MLGSTIGLGNLIATELIGLDEGLGVSDRFCCWVGKKGGGGGGCSLSYLLFKKLLHQLMIAPLVYPTV